MELAPIFEPGFYGGSWVWENNVSEQKLKDLKIGRTKLKPTPKPTSK
jgi:hypothetical protein